MNLDEKDVIFKLVKECYLLFAKGKMRHVHKGESAKFHSMGFSLIGQNRTLLTMATREQEYIQKRFHFPAGPLML